jgi:hypothetical protein
LPLKYEAEAGLGWAIALVGGEAIPPHRLRVVPGDTRAVEIHHGEEGGRVILRHEAR